MDRLALMETFVRVLETGSFSAAARHLNVGQSAVSKSIAQLEDRLGVRLLMRSTHSLTPTEAGQIYYERACRVIDEAHEADLDADFVRDAFRVVQFTPPGSSCSGPVRRFLVAILSISGARRTSSKPVI
jgi:DNA-binding transcriptional LysR family regulator